MVNDIDILYGSVCGRTHRNTGKPNQDSLNIKFTKMGIAIAVADGHGSALSFRSQIGSKLAVKVAVESGNTLAESGLRGADFLAQWSKSLVSAWAREVLGNLKKHPFEDSEVAALNKRHTSALASNALFAYGTTITAAYLVDDLFHIINLGDSDALIKIGDKVNNVRLVDERMVGGMTYSLATEGCVHKFAAEAIRKTDISSIMLATDGYQNSFVSKSDFEKVIVDIENIYHKNTHLNIHSQFETWLKDTSDNGSGDDITAIILLNNKISDR